MESKVEYTASLGSAAEDLFLEIFTEVFGPDRSQYLSVQHPFLDIYGNRRFIDFALNSEGAKIAIEIDGETYHRPGKVSNHKYYDDLLKQNSLVYERWQVYRWAYLQLRDQRDKVADELRTFIGESPTLRIFQEYLPEQRGEVLELREHQQSALDSLEAMRERGDSIALLYHATGTGKTITAASDAKRLGGRTLFLAHTRELVHQAKEAFQNIWPERRTGVFVSGVKDTDVHVLCASMQSMVKNLEGFRPDEFDYIIVDECHHGTASSYTKIMGFFEPQFTLGLTATPERMDGQDLLELFQSVAHKLDLRTAVELGELTPIRCVRVKTDIDFSRVRINGIRYHSQDLESKLFVPERNRLIVETYKEYALGKKTVIFCASVAHAEEISRLLAAEDIASRAVSGKMKPAERAQCLEDYEHGSVNILCACDLLNEGWDSPRTEVLFMARPTLSKTLYLQQLGRGLRRRKGKDHLLVLDFIDNANLFNAPYSLHRLLNMREYRPGQLVLGPKKQVQREQDLWMKGERPEVCLDFPVGLVDLELVELFNWQEKVKDMVSQLELVRMVDVQSETVERYIREGRLVPDLEVPLGETRSFKYFHGDTVKRYALEYGWEFITPSNMRDKFMDMVRAMDMSYSYKPVLLKAMFEHMDDQGRVRVQDIVDYFIEFYQDREARGLVVEKANSIFAKDGFSRKDVERNIFANPFKRFSDMRFMSRCKDVEFVELNAHIRRKLRDQDVQWIRHYSDQKLAEYYERFPSRDQN